MAWETRYGKKFFYRGRRVDGVTRKDYFGAGPVASMAAALVERDKRSKAAEAAVIRAEAVRLERPERLIEALESGCQTLLAAEFLAAGYHRHDRGPWRRKRHVRVLGDRA